MTPRKLLPLVKENLILTHDEDDAILLRIIAAAIDYAEGYQHVAKGYYIDNDMPAMTKQAVIMLTTHLYESRDSGTGGFFADSAAAGVNTRETIDKLVRLERRWSV